MPDDTAVVAHDSAAADVVGIEDCQRVSQDLSAILDVEDALLELPDVKYTLEVSSPGLDRPLRSETDYVRFQGRLAKIVTSEPIDGQSSFAGRLAGVEHEPGGVPEVARKCHRDRVQNGSARKSAKS